MAVPTFATKGRRLKKLEMIRTYHCKACDRGFTPGPRAMPNKTYPLGELLEALTAYNQAFRLMKSANASPRAMATR